MEETKLKPFIPPPDYISDWEEIAFIARDTAPVSERTLWAIGEIFASMKPAKGEAQNRRRYEALSAIVEQVYKSFLAQRPLAMSTNTRAFDLPERYRPDWFRYSVVKPVIKRLVDGRYITIRKGYVSKDGKHHKTHIYATYKLRKLFPMAFRTQLKETIVLREKVEYINKNKKRVTKREAVPYTDTDTTVEMRTFVQDYNDFAKRFSVTYGDHVLNTNLHRVFSDEWNRGGRFYGEPQNLPKSERVKILIDGEEVKEYDYSSLHISLIYDLEGLKKPEGDLYSIVSRKLEVAEGDIEAFRIIPKTMQNLMFNCESRTSALRALNDELSKQERALMAKYHVKAADVYDTILEVHAPIKNWFGTSRGLSLQFVDSLLMENTLSRLMSHGILALPVHDSAIVKARDYDSLKFIMDDARKNIIFCLRMILISNTNRKENND